MGAGSKPWTGTLKRSAPAFTKGQKVRVVKRGDRLEGQVGKVQREVAQEPRHRLGGPKWRVGFGTPGVIHECANYDSDDIQLVEDSNG
jgi:membrane protein implicated in regulation of membrane protease activity